MPLNKELLGRSLMWTFGHIFYLTASFFRGNLSSRNIHGSTVGVVGEGEKGWHLQWLQPHLLLFLFLYEFMAAGEKGAGIVWKQHPPCRCCYSEHLTIAKCPLSQTGNHWRISCCHSWSISSTGAAGWTVMEGCGSVSKAGLNPKSRMLCPRQTAEWLLWLKRFIMAVRSAAAVASKPPGISPGAEITFCVSQFSLARNFLIPCLTLRAVHSGTSW